MNRIKIHLDNLNKKRLLIKIYERDFNKIKWFNKIKLIILYDIKELTNFVLLEYTRKGDNKNGKKI